MAGGSKAREWIRKRMMPRSKAAGSGSSGSGAPEPPAPPAGSKLRARAFSSALRWRPRVAAVLYEKVVYHLLWLVESVVVVARLCFFLMRFGFKL